MSVGAIIMLFLIAAVTWIWFKIREQGQRIVELGDVLVPDKEGKKSPIGGPPGPPQAR
jgi:hypothetical protein